MADEVAQKADGTGAMFSVGKTPWHRKGQVMEKAPASMEAALDAGGLDFDVDLKPIFVEGSTPERQEGAWHRVPGHLASFRTDTGEVLGIVGSRYTPIQNRDAFQVLEPLIDSKKATLETGGVLRGGRDVWLLVRFAVSDPVVKEVFADEVVPFGLLSNNHAGQRGVTLQETPIRVVCANTLGAAHRTAKVGKVFRIRHTVNVGLRTVEAAEQLWGALIERYRVVAEQYQILRAQRLQEAAFGQLVLDAVAPIKAEWLRADSTKGQQEAVERAMARRGRIKHLWTEGKGHKADHSSWEAYNAVVETIDHDVELWPSRENRLASLFDGHLNLAKQRVLDGLTDHAAAGT